MSTHGAFDQPRGLCKLTSRAEARELLKILLGSIGGQVLDHFLDLLSVAGIRKFYADKPQLNAGTNRGYQLHLSRSTQPHQLPNLESQFCKSIFQLLRQ